MDKIFYKPLPDHTQAQIKALFDHARAVFQAFKGVKDVTVPEALRCDKAGISYTYLALPSRSMSELLKDVTCPQDLAFKAGQSLARFHKASGGKLLHADFVPHNVFAGEGTLYIIDPHPPEFLGFREDLLYGPSERDVVSFVYCIFSNVGARNLFSAFRYYQGIAEAFLKGYGYTGKGLIRALIGQSQNVIAMKRRAGLGSWHAVRHAFFYAAITLWVTGKVLWKRKL